MAPMFSCLGAAKEVLVTGLTLLEAGCGLPSVPVGVIVGFQVEPPLNKPPVTNRDMATHQ